MIFNSQIDIITNMCECLENSLILKNSKLKNLTCIVLGMILSKSTVMSNISEKLKSDFSTGTEPSKIKKIYRFFSSKINHDVYFFFANYILTNFKAEDNKINIMFDHTSCDDRFLILTFMLSIGKRGIPIYYKVFEYTDKENLIAKHVKDGLLQIKELVDPYNYEVIVMADRGVRGVDLLKFINETLKWTYYIRLIGNTKVYIEEDPVIGKLKEIELKKKVAKFYYNVKLTDKKYICNITAKINDEDNEVWYVATNADPHKATTIYSRRFTIEEMFKDMKSNGFDMEATWTESLTYFENLMLCISIGYTFVIVQGSMCAKNKLNKYLGATKKTLKNQIIRIYSIFRTGLKWINICYYSDIPRKLNYFCLYDL